MKTIEEVKEHFKYAKKVRCLCDEKVFDVSKRNTTSIIDDFDNGVWWDEDVQLCQDNKLAEIVEYDFDNMPWLYAAENDLGKTYLQNKCEEIGKFGLTDKDEIERVIGVMSKERVNGFKFGEKLKKEFLSIVNPNPKSASWLYKKFHQSNQINNKCKDIEKLANEYPCSYSEIKDLKDSCDLDSTQLKKVIELSLQGNLNLKDVANALKGFNDTQQSETYTTDLWSGYRHLKKQKTMKAKLTLETAKSMFKEGGAGKQFALDNFSEKELIDKKVEKWEDLGEIKGWFVDMSSNIRGIKTDANYASRIVFTTKALAKSSRAKAMLSQLMKEADIDEKRYIDCTPLNILTSRINMSINFSIPEDFYQKHEELFKTYLMID